MHDCFLSYICGEVGDGAVAFFCGDWGGGAFWCCHMQLRRWRRPHLVICELSLFSKKEGALCRAAVNSDVSLL